MLRCAAASVLTVRAVPKPSTSGTQKPGGGGERCDAEHWTERKAGVEGGERIQKKREQSYLHCQRTVKVRGREKADWRRCHACLLRGELAHARASGRVRKSSRNLGVGLGDRGSPPKSRTVLKKYIQSCRARSRLLVVRLSRRLRLRRRFRPSRKCTVASSP